MPSASWLFPLLLPAGLIAPGWLLGRALRAPAGPAGALLGSAALLMNLVLALDALRRPLDLAHLAIGLGLICGVLAAIAAFRDSKHPGAPTATREKFSWSRPHWLLVPAGVGLVAIAVRALLDPLSGFDTFFRWDFLAREMLRTGHLHFYPAVTPQDFLHYGWCDGIAPLVSTLYFWSYASLGHVAAWATAPVVVAQAAALGWLVWQLAARHGGATAGHVALALLATNAWLLWAVAMGQETGFTALGLLGLFYFLDRARTQPEARWTVWAGVAAGAGALAREYGLAFILVGLATLAWQQTPRRGWLGFSIAAGAVALPWYLRNWARTGNPLWSHSLGGVFPTNPVNEDYLRVVGELYGVAAHPGVLLAAAILLTTAIGPLLLGAIGVGSLRREQAPWLLGLGSVGALWLWSVGQTSGGCAYSLRVLAPAFALGAVLGGQWLARWVTSSRVLWLTAVLSVLAGDAAGRSLYLPISTAFAWWREPARAWRDFGRNAARFRNDPNWQAIAEAADGRKILVSDPSCHTTLLERGAKAVPFFSPEIGFIFGSGRDFSAEVARLRALNFRFVVLTRGNNFNDMLTARHPFFPALQATRPAGVTKLYFVYDLYSIPPAPRSSNAP